jgi:predicted ATP-grasp superfamily ATP-dependent carboligase
MKILVTDGNNRASLAITRSLGRKGHRITVGEVAHPALASSSKYCHGRFTYPSPIDNPDLFIERLIEIIQEKKIDVLLPVSDVTTIQVCENKLQLEQFCKVPFPDADTVKLAANKGQLFRLAAQLGVPVPQSIWLEEYTPRFRLPENMPFPVVIKPCHSRIRTNKGWLSTSVKYAYNQTELMRIVREESTLAFPLVIQERIIGPGVGIFVCYNNGSPIAFFSHRRIREKPPSGGVSVLRESISVSPEAKEFSERLLSSLGWHGVAMVEFKIDQLDNMPKLMEINGRFWGSLQLAIDAGVDFPGLLIDTLRQDEVKPVTRYRIGVKTRWLLGDLDSLLMILFKNREDLKLPPNHKGKIKYLLEFLKLWDKNMHYEVLSRDDIKPWLFEFAQWLKQSK